jgi:TonB family protein
MNKRKGVRLPLLLGLLLLARPGSSLIADSYWSTHEAPTATGQIDVGWLPLAPEGEEFSAVTPAVRTMYMSPNFHFEPGGEEVLEKRSYSGYANGFVFVIESFRAAKPQKIFKSVVKNTLGGASFRRDVMVDGFQAKEYGRSNDVVYDRSLYLVAKKHIYVLRLVALDEKNPGIERLLNSFKLGDHGIARTRSTENQLTASSTAAGEVLSTKEVTRKPRVVWKPEPAYTVQARQHQLTGTVALKAIFRADGQVTDITVVAGLPEGLTDKAIDAARNIRFFPAEKDGRVVSQEIRLDYNFNLY